MNLYPWRAPRAGRLAHALLFSGLLVSSALLDAQDAGSGTAPSDPGARPSANAFHVDPVHSMALFRIHHQGVGMFHGRFLRLHGNITFDPDAGAPLQVHVTIPLEGLDSGSPRIDAHLRSPDFFDAARFENMTFESSGSKRVGEKNFEVSGRMTLHGVTQDIKVPFEWVGSADSEKGKRHGFESQFVIRRSDYGMTYGVESKSLGDEVRVTVALELLPGPAPSESDEATRGGGRAGSGMRDRLLALDKDGNGKIEKSEVPENMMRVFERMDANKDGVIDEAELAAPPRRRGGEG